MIHDTDRYIKEFFQGFKEGRLQLIQTEYLVALVVVNQILTIIIGPKMIILLKEAAPSLIFAAWDAT